jgi:hypothetical protein
MLMTLKDAVEQARLRFELDPCLMTAQRFLNIYQVLFDQNAET